MIKMTDWRGSFDINDAQNNTCIEPAITGAYERYLELFVPGARDRFPGGCKKYFALDLPGVRKRYNPT